MNTLTGVITLVSGSITGHDTRADLIQKFQSKLHPESGRWNHSLLCWQTRPEFRTVEAVSGGVLPGNLGDYTREDMTDKVDLLFLVPTIQINEKIFEDLLIQYIGTPYATIELIRESVIYTLTGKWVGRNGRRAARRMRCHEFAMFIWNEYWKEVYNHELFPNWYKGDVDDIYTSLYFTHQNSVPNPFKP